MHIGALWQSGVRSPGPGRDSPSVLSWIWMMLFGGMHRTVQAVFSLGGTTPCMAYWLKLSGRGQWGRAGEKYSQGP
jgi:hypothetical protein